MISIFTFTKRLAFFVLALIFISTQFVFAQENVPVDTPLPPLSEEQLANPPPETEGVVVLIATVNIYDAVIQKQDGRTISVAFTLSNREGVQPGITYAAHLTTQGSPNAMGMSIGVFPAKEKVMLRENDNQAKTLTFTVPDSVNAGEYTVEILASNSSGINLARQKAGKVTLPKSNGGIIFRGNQCVLHIADETPIKDYSPFAGIDIAQNENMVLDCSVTNTTDRTLQVVPSFVTYRRNIASGVQVDTPDVSNDPIILSAGETKKISLRLPHATLPQAYDVSVDLGDHTGALISDTVVVHYVVRGASATIQNLLLDKDSYIAGDTASATVTFSRSADHFPGTRVEDGNGTSIDIVNIELSLVDMNAQVCADPVIRSISMKDSIQQNFSFPVTKNCEKPTITVKLINEDDGTVLDTVSASLAPAVPTTDIQPEIKSFVPKNEPLFSKEFIIIGTIIFVLLVLLGVFGIKVARSKGWMLGLVFLCILGLSGVTGVDEAKADTIYTTTTAYPVYNWVWNPNAYLGYTISTLVCHPIFWYDCWYEDVPAYGPAWEYVLTGYTYINGTLDVNYTYNLNKLSYTAGETMYTSVYGYYWTCTNSSYSLAYAYVRPHQDAGFSLLSDNKSGSSLAEEKSPPKLQYTWLYPISSLWSIPKAEAFAYLGYMSVSGSFTVSPSWNTTSPYATFWFYSIVPKWAAFGGISNFYRNIPYTIKKIPTVTFTASPNPILSNTGSTLTWSSTDATSCTAGGSWSGVKGTSGSFPTGNLTTSQTYTLYCTGPAGNSSTQTITVSIIPIPVITSFTASPNPVAYNTGSTLTWSSTGATSCTATGDWSGVKASSGSYPTGNLTVAKTYTLTCTGPGGTSAPESVTVTVLSPLPDIISLGFTATVPSTGGKFFDGQNIVLAGTMKNIGSLATSLAFDDNFSYRWNGAGAWTKITPYTTHPAGFAIGAVAADSGTLNPSGSGTLNIQYCVDSNNSILESDEFNCMEKSFTVHPKPTGNLTITSPVPYNSTSSISWTTNNPDPTACIPQVAGGGDTWSGLSGTKVSSLLTSDTLYSLTCAPYPGVLDSKLVDVSTDPFIKASPRVVPSSGGTAMINWGTGMEANCSITKNSIPWVPLTTGIGSKSDFVTANTTYTIDCPVVDKSIKVEVQGYGMES